MSVFIRRFLTDPGQTILLNIESVNILDLQPPASIQGIGSGTVLIVGEFEDGAFATSTEVVGSTDLQQNWGTLGFTYNSVVGNYPCAVSRKADGAIVAENWNGNAFVQLSGKQFARLLVCRVDTSVGSVQLARLAYVEGANSFRYQLSSGQILSIDVGAGFTSATFTGTVASLTSVPNVALGGTVSVTNGSANITFSTNQTLPAGTAIVFSSQPGVVYTLNAAVNASTAGVLTGNYLGTTNGAATSTVAKYNTAAGDTLVLGYDAASNFTTTFLSTDNTLANIVARINQYAGFALAAVVGGVFSLTGVQGGTGGRVQVVSGSAGVLAALGLTATTATGGGNVANIAAVTPQEVALVVQAAIANTKVEQNSSGSLRISNTGAGGFIAIGASTTAANLGFTSGQFATSLGQAMLQSGAGTYNTGFGGTETLTFAVDGVQYTAAFAAGDQTLVQVVARLNTTVGRTVAATDGATAFTITGATPGGSVSIIGSSAAGVLTTLGLSVKTVVGVLPPQGILPAGTVVQQLNGQIFVTMQSLTFAGGRVTLPGNTVPLSGNSYSVKIRHAVDDGTGTSTTAGSITQITNPPDIGAFSCVNGQITSAALTETQIDVQYIAALAATKDINTVAKQTNIIYSARQSNQVRKNLKQNVLDASANGCFGRMACIRPPLGTTKTTAQSTTAEPGVGAYRDQRVIYCWPGFNTFVPLIGQRGTSGGNGFTADGNIDVGSDGFMASILSQLPPEENPGQETNFTVAVNSLEVAASQSGSIGSFQMQDYINFKAAGIAAARMDDGVAIFQSGVTSVDPALFPNLVRISRRRMADFIQDSVAQRCKAYGKRLSTVARRLSLSSEVRAFMLTLLSAINPAFQRIGGFTVDPKTGNTPQTLAAGRFRIVLNVQTLASLDSIEIATTIGENVQVNEVLPQAA